MKLRKYLLLLVALPCLFMAFTTQGGKDDKPSKSVIEFLTWYKQHHNRLNNINIVKNYVNGSGPTGGNYEMDYKQVEHYLTELKKSTYIGPKYVEKWRKYFKKAGEDFKNNPQSSGPPRGFEYDLVMLTQDFDKELNNLDKMEIKSELIESNNYALVMIKFSSGRVVKYELAKQNNKWLINDISV